MKNLSPFNSPSRTVIFFVEVLHPPQLSLTMDLCFLNTSELYKIFALIFRSFLST